MIISLRARRYTGDAAGGGSHALPGLAYPRHRTSLRLPAHDGRFGCDGRGDWRSRGLCRRRCASLAGAVVTGAREGKCMNTSRLGVTAVASGVVVVLLLGFVTLTGLSASLAWSQSGGYGGGPGICLSVTVTLRTGSPTPVLSAATPSPTGTAPGCVPAHRIGAQVVALAKEMADALYVKAACGGHISYPDCYYTWYKAPGSTYPPGLPTFPQAAID